MPHEGEDIERSHGAASASGDPERFDAQAPHFDVRAGLPAGVARTVARAVIEIAGVGPDGLLVELGAGTGEIGQHLIESIGYVGIDRSRGMLELFGARLGSTGDDRVQLFCTDANGPWPVGDGSAAVVFASRAAHLLDAEHLLAELHRVCRPGGHFLVGRVMRDPDGVKSRLRRQRRQLLRQHGVAPRGARDATERVFGELVACGAVRMEPRSIATWTASASVREILDAWRAVGAMGGRQLDAATRASVLTELQSWAAGELGGVGEVAAWDERYVLEGARMEGGRRRACRVGTKHSSRSG